MRTSLPVINSAVALRSARPAAAVLALLLIGSVQMSAQPVTVRRIDARHWTISIRNDAPSVDVTGGAFGGSAIRMPGYSALDLPGSPELPDRRISFGLPAHGRLRVTVRSLDEQATPARLTDIPMTRSETPGTGGVRADKPSAAPSRQRRIDGQTVPFPPGTEDVGGRGYLRVGPVTEREGLHRSELLIVPAQYDAAHAIVHWIRALEIDVRLDDGAGAADLRTARGTSTAPGTSTTAGTSTPAGTSTAPGTSITAGASASAIARATADVVNAADAASWMRVAVSAPAAATWFTPDEQMLRITTREEGIHRMLGADLAAAGVQLATVDPHRLQLWNHGEEQPLLVTGEADGRLDAQDTIIFHAVRLTGGDGEYFNPWSDDNVYFLGFSGTNPRRFAPMSAVPGAAPEIATRLAGVHLERDSVYHLGDHELVDMTETEQVLGEGWVWTYLFKKDSLAHHFTLGLAPDGESALKVRLRSASVDPSRAVVSVNGMTLDSIDLAPYAIAVREFSVPAGLLRAGGNTIVIRNPGIVACPPNDPFCSIERLYVDWAEFRMHAAYAAIGDRLAIPADTTRAAQRGVAVMSGFSTSDILILNLDASTVLTGATITGGADAWTARVLLSTDSSYAVAATSGMYIPRSIMLRRMIIPDAADNDDILVTHEAFRAQAARLAAYRRQHDGYRVMVAEVEDIYNAFNGGIKDPLAIRRFMKDAWDRSAEPRPRFLTILGDASWDPKLLQEGSTKTDYVPAYGNPVSDNQYVAFGQPPYEVRPMMSSGRIPAENAADADAMIDKIIAYEALPPRPWDNRILFSIGGENQAEQLRYLLPPVQSLTASYVDPRCLQSDRVIKRAFDQGVTYEDLDTLVARMNAGTSWFYFIGHGGSRIIDVGIERPDIFTLAGRHPFFITMSCNTAHFAEPYEVGLNERFTMAAGNGAIASLGTSGLGEIGHDYALTQGMFDAVLRDSIRTYGEMMMHAKQYLVDVGGISDGFVRSTVNQYVLLGDPATRIPLATSAELLVEPGDISTTPAILLQQNSATVHATLHNAGMCIADSVDVLLTVSSQGREVHRERRRIAPFRAGVTVEWTHDFAALEGAVTIAVEIDPDGRLIEKTHANNRAEITRTVLPRGITPIFPLADAAIRLTGTPRIDFVVANPSEMPADPSARVEVEISTSHLMNANLVTLTAEPGDVYTTVPWATVNGSLTKYWWRARLRTAAGGDWSAIRSVSISGSEIAGERFSLVSPRAWNGLTLRNLRISGEDLVLGARVMEIDVASGGFNNYTFKSTQLRADGIEYSPNRRGFNVAVFSARDGSLLDTANFDTYWTSDEARRMASWLRGQPDDAIISAAVLDDANGYFNPDSPVRSNILPELKTELARLGARLVDSIGFRDSWAFIGTRREPSRAREAHLAFGAVFFRDTFTVQAVEGAVVSGEVGPANAWTSMWWEGGEAPGATVRLCAWLPREGADSLFFASAPVAPNEHVPLTVLPPASTVRMRLGAVLVDSSGRSSPIIRSLHAEYTSAFPEVGVTSRTVVISPDSVVEGEPIDVRVGVHNAGRASAVDLPVTLNLPPEAGGRTETRRISVLAPGGDSSIVFAIPTGGIRTSATATVTVNPARATEYYLGNDAYARGFRAARDAVRPELSVLFDGQEIVNNDIVSPRPVITISMRDKSPLPVTDTSSVQVALDGARLWLVGNPQVQLSLGGSGEEKVTLRYTPELRTGWRRLEVSARDASGNPADSLPYAVRFLVTADNRVDNVYPFPNPSPGATDFTFRLLGSDVPLAARIRIYTVAGRLIRELDAAREDLHIGFNRIPFDGRDGDGDHLANGTYFYRLTLERSSGVEEYTGRLAVLR